MTLLPSPNPRDAAVVSFTGHVFVIADVSHEWLAERLRPGELSEAFAPPFLGALAAHLGRRVSAIDMVALAPAIDGPPELALDELVDSGRPESRHVRVVRARRYRRDIRVYAARGGLVVLGRGLVDRWEVAVEVDEAYRGRGLGRRLATAARHLIPSGDTVWAQIAPGNAASVRAFLAGGYRPVGQEALLVTHERSESR